MNQGMRSQTSMQSRALRKAAAFLLLYENGSAPFLGLGPLPWQCRHENEHLEWDETENPDLDELESEHSGSPLAYEAWYSVSLNDLISSLLESTKHLWQPGRIVTFHLQD